MRQKYGQEYSRYLGHIGLYLILFLSCFNNGGLQVVWCAKKPCGIFQSKDSDCAEVFAMLMGCHELCKLGAHNAIIEGDSFSA